MSDKSYSELAKEYFDGAAHEFYRECWGGENHHLGLFEGTDNFFEAAKKTNENFLSKLNVKEGDRILDIGSGFCGLPRFLVKNTQCSKVVGLNISEKENEYAQKKNREEGVGHLIDIVSGDFNKMPFSDDEFDILVSQDAMLHSPDKDKLLQECRRVLKDGGQFVFTDILRLPELSDEEARIVYARVNIPYLAAYDEYIEALRRAGFTVREVQELGSYNVGRSYECVCELVERQRDRLLKETNISEEMLDKMMKGLKYWSKKAYEGKIGWGLFINEV